MMWNWGSYAYGLATGVIAVLAFGVITLIVMIRAGKL